MKKPLHELVLWRHLQTLSGTRASAQGEALPTEDRTAPPHEPPTADALAAGLSALASRPPRERIACLGEIEACLAHEAPALRRGALEALGGAAGPWAKQHLIAGLADEATRATAFMALARSCAHDPMQWWHVLLHPDEAVRREAILSLPEEFPRYWLLLLLPDAANRALVLELLEPFPEDPAALPLLLSMAQAGEIPRLTLLRWLARLPWERQAGIYLPPLQGKRVIVDLPESPEELEAFLTSPLLESSGLDALFLILWQEMERHPQGETGRLARSIFAQIFNCVRRKMLRAPAVHVAVSIARIGFHQWSWEPVPLAICGLVMPGLLRHRQIAAPIRKQAIALYNIDMRLFDPPEGLFERLLCSDLCYHSDGRLSLSQLAGAMRLIEHPYKELATFFRAQDIQAALRKAPHDAMSFFARAPQTKGDQEQYDAYLRAFCDGNDAPAVQASLALLVPVYQLENTLRPAGTEASRIELLRALFKVYESAPKSPPEHKTNRIAEQMMPLIAPHLKATLAACVEWITIPSDLWDNAASDDLWHRWYEAQPSPEHLASKPLLLVTELMTLLGRHVPHDEICDTIEALPEAELEACLTLLSCSPLFSYDAAKAIARRLSTKTAPSILAWCQLHNPAAPPPKMNAVASEGPQAPTLLKTQDAQALTTASEAVLKRLLEPYMAHGSLGLCEALKARGKQAPSLAICSALLTCHDPPEEVVSAFTAYSKAEEGFAKQLDQKMVKHCDRAPSMPLLGLAWMYRWEHHRARLQAHFAAEPEGFLRGLRWALHLEAPALALRLWQGIKLTMQQWRWREPEQLARYFQAPELCGLLRGVLLHHSLPEDERIAPNIATELQIEAARIIEVLVVTGLHTEALQPLRMELLTQLSALPLPLQRALAHWLNARYPTMSRQASVPPPLVPPALLEEIAATTDLDILKGHCLAPQAQVVEEAACQLLMLDGGVEVLRSLWHQELPVASARGIASTLPLWPEDADLTMLHDRLASPNTPASNRFFLALGLAERGATTWKAALSAMKEPSTPWASREDWRQLAHVARQPAHGATLVADLTATLDAQAPPRDAALYDAATQAQEPGDVDPSLLLAIALIDAPHEPIQSQALQAIMAQPPPLASASRRALVRYLRAAEEAPAPLKLEVARRLHQAGCDEGLPLLLASTYHPRTSESTRKHRIHTLFDTMAAPQLLACIKGALLLGSEHIDLRQMLADLERRRVDPQARQEALLLVLRHGPAGQFQQLAVGQLTPTSRRRHHVNELARIFAWGIQKGRELTGKLFKIELLAGDDLGYTRLSSPRIHINPLPMLRREQYGEDIVRGLILHELGHHIYHADEIGLKTWKQAEEEKLQRLLNLVSDEQLERSLRAKDRAFGNDLKRLAAYAFQHSTRELIWTDLLASLGPSAFATLCGASLQAGRKHSHVVVELGHLLFALEAQGKSFARFVRALRMGLGNRHNDPKVDEALRLFNKKFRRSTMPEMLEIARSLRDIFGDEVALLDLIDQQDGMACGSDEVVVIGEGMTQEELQREIDRLIRGGPRATNKGAPGRTINVAKGEEFRQIHTIIPVRHDRAEHRNYAVQTTRWSRKMRGYLQRLGLGMVPQRKRLSGHRLDRGQLQNAVLRHDPRILTARKIEFKTDLFLGILIDCSGSMEINDNIEKARLFASMLAEAAAPLKGVDARFIGFNDTVLYDAGTAQRCAAHGLEVGGGNNDAAALWHAARLAQASARKAKLIVMISDGSPTECTVEALQSLVTRVTDRMGICCAQIALRSLDHICFPHYVEVLDDNVDLAIHKFGTIIARLVQKAIAS